MRHHEAQYHDQPITTRAHHVERWATMLGRLHGVAF